MFEGKTVFTQIMEFVPWRAFQKIIDSHGGDVKVRTLKTHQLFRVLAFAQLTNRRSLRDTVATLRAVKSKWYHMGITSVSRNNLSNASQQRDWKIFADFAQVLMATAQKMYAEPMKDEKLDAKVFALDSNTFDLCLSVFPWAEFRSTKAAVKMHTLLDTETEIPGFIRISTGKTHDVNIEMDKTTGVRCDQTVVPDGFRARKRYPEKLRRIKFYDAEKRRRFVFLTNHFSLPAETVAALYKRRWKVELFFKWIKQHLRLRPFFGQSENAVRCQIWIAVSTYILVAIIKKLCRIDRRMSEILQIFSVTLFENIAINTLFCEKTTNPPSATDAEQPFLPGF